MARLTTKERAKITHNLKIYSNRIFIHYPSESILNEVDELILESELNGSRVEFGCAELEFDSVKIEDLTDFEIISELEFEQIDVDWMKRILLKELKDLRNYNQDLIDSFLIEKKYESYLDREFECSRDN